MIKKYLLIVLFLFSLFSFGQNPAMIENTFNTNNISNVSGGVISGFDKCFPMPDGKILVYMNCTGCRFNGVPIRKYERLNADGTLDVTYNPSGSGVTGGISDTYAYTDGKALIAGDFTTYNGVSTTGIVKLNSDGSKDTSFSTSLNSSVSRIVVQPDGKIIIGGFFTTYNGTTYNRILRLNPDGSVDASFNIGAGFDASVSSLVLQNDGKIVVGGSFTNYNGIAANRIIRLNPDGSVDASFVVGTGFNNSVSSIVRSQDNKYFIGGTFTSYNGITNNRIVKLDADGSIDSSFVVGSGFNNAVSKIIALPTGGIFVLGTFTYYTASYKPGCVKLNNVGGIDNLSLLSNSYQLKDAFVQSDAKIILAGRFSSLATTVVNSIARLNSNETVDDTFAIGVGFNYIVNKVTLQPDGKILACGDFSLYNNTRTIGLIRLNRDGAIDATFDLGTGFNNSVYDAEVQPDGKIIAGGSFTTFNGVPANSLVRLNPDGSLDTTFNIGTGFTGKINDIILQPDGKILVAGAFTSFNGDSLLRNFIRLNANGSIDLHFQSVTSEVNVILLQPDGKALAGFASGDIRRYKIDGTSDFTFFAPSNTVTAMINVGVTSLQLQSSGKIIVGGDFNTATNNLMRLNATGSKDTSFLTGTGFNGAIRSVMIQPDDKVIVGGSYSTYNGSSAWHGVRLHTNGAIDPSFNTGLGFTGSIYDIKLQPDGKILFAGAMVNYGTYVAGGLVRLIGGGFYNLSGQNKLDANLNGCDTADYPFPNLKMNFNDGFSNYDFFVNNTGDYSFLLGQGNYTITPVVNSNFSISPTSITANFPSQFTSLVQNYCITPLNGSYADLEVEIIPVNSARPGFDSQYKLIYKNKGVVTQSGAVSLNFDDQVADLTAAVPATDGQSTNTLSWNFTNLNPQETRVVNLTFNLNSPMESPALNMGDVLNYTASFSGILTDYTPSDNVFSLNQNVVNSYDPNDKTCLQGNTVGPEKIGDYVHYVIRFENNGTANAEFIRIQDAIDTAKFDISTLEPLYGSHNFITKISDTNKVEFFFNNINLPFDDANNDGFVAYKIKLKPSLTIGDIFTNTASIYFDFNTAIVTNTAQTTITALGNQDFVANTARFVIYPNPVTDYLNIKNNSNAQVYSFEIYNLMGQLIVSASSSERNEVIDVRHLESGCYLLKCRTGNNIQSVKFIKK